MVTIIQNRLEQIKFLCQKYQIEKLWLFGSALDESEFTAESDIDFLFTYDDGGIYDPAFPYVHSFLNLKKELEQLFKRKIDLIGYKKFRNPYFRKAVEQTKVAVYEKESTNVSV